MYRQTYWKPGAAGGGRMVHGGSQPTDKIAFYINGTKHNVSLSETYSPTTSLNAYLREKAGLPGTKVMCREAGCGCCAVTVTIPDAEGNGRKTQSINSCLCPLLSVDGWEITTVEGLGSEKDGFHPIQQRIAAHSGTQCGYCTPGMVMNMYGLLHDNPLPTEQEIEDSFDGNICRCTGYRPILDAMKSFAVDSRIPGGKVIDIEDLNKKLCPKNGQPCKDPHGRGASGPKTSAPPSKNGAPSAKQGKDIPSGLTIVLPTVRWHRPTCLNELGSIMRGYKDARVRLLFGNTSAGIFKNEGPFDVYVDLREVMDMYGITCNTKSMKIGANTSLTTLIKELKARKDDHPGFQYFGVLVRHLKLVGNVLMRNAASVAGNLMIKHYHPEFPSDVFTMTEAAGAKVDVYDCSDGKVKSYSVMDFVRKVDMKGKVLTALEMPALDPQDHFRSFKITPRSQNAHAYVNAAFRIKVGGPSGQRILDKPAIVIGGINEKFFHAEKTEDSLTGKELTDKVVQDALNILKSEVKPAPDPVLSTPEYRRDLAVNLLYKTLLGIGKPSQARLQTGRDNLERPISNGLQTFQETRDEWPLKQPMPKKTAILQASGEAEFVNDMPRYQRELCGALVITTVASATIDSINPAPALAMPGVVQFITAEDIPEGGINEAYAKYKNWPGLAKEEVFCTGKVEYAGQAVGMILAETQTLADQAAERVVIKYKDIKPPIITLEQAMAADSYHPIPPVAHTVGKPDDAMANAAKTVTGEIRMGTQYHFYMETMACICVPGEEGMDVYLTTQGADLAQPCIAAILNKPANYVNVHVPRLGGSFGGKIMFANHIGLATAVAAYRTHRPVRMSLSLSTSMKFTGKRFPLLARYKAGFSADGKVDAVSVEFYMDGGATNTNMFSLMELVHQIDQGYHVPNWKITPHMLKTNTAPSTTCRGPGTTPDSAIIETIMEHVAKEVNRHPIFVKEINLYEKHQTDINGKKLTYCTMRDVWDRLKTVADVNTRMTEVDAFNQASQWKKRGITMCAVKYGMLVKDHGFPLLLSVYGHDGTVTVVQGGVEMGQGLYMKVAQAVAHALGIPVEMVKVRPNLSYAVPNASITGGSTASEKAVKAALEACKILRERLEPIKAKMPDADWPTLVHSALMNKVDLSAKVSPFSEAPDPTEHHAYFTYTACVAETEVDILTGEYAIRRVDIMFDCGESLNPTIDIGQIEGGFVHGLGFSLLEDVIYDKNTGVLLNDGTWEYKPPTTKDVPIDWRIHLLPDAPNPVGVRSSKATGEPSTGLAVSALLAIKLGLESAQKDLKGQSSFLNVEIPYTLEKIQQSLGITVQDLKL